MKYRRQGSFRAGCILAAALLSEPVIAKIATPKSNRFLATGKGLSLTGSGELVNLATKRKLQVLTDRADLMFKDKLWTLLIESTPQFAFYSERVDLRLKNKWSRGLTRHYRYEITLDGIALNGANLTAHFSGERLKAVTIAAPEFARVLHYPHEAVELGLAEEADGKRARYVSVNQELKVALIYRKKTRENLYLEIWEDGLTGDIIESKIAGFDLVQGRVQTENARDSETKMMPLTDLTSEHYLDGKYFSVNSEYESGRVRAEAKAFDYQPHDSERFDQVAAYFNLSQGLNWFFNHLGYNFQDPAPISVVVGSGLDGNPNNARYVPRSSLTDGPMLIFGRGSFNEFENLGRDRDVAMHELSHHIIYRFIDDARGDAGALHEGFSDYFTYAMTEDPFLAEQVVAGSPYLRSALLPKDKSFDNPYLQRNAHNLGQIWSAFLWETRKKVGAEFDKTVFHALHYLNAGSSFGDAIEALMLADVDNNPQYAALGGQSATHGPHKCEILKAAVARGYAGFLAHLDASSCGLDIQAFAAEQKPTSEYDDGPLLLQGCGQIAKHNHLASLTLLIFSLIIPLTTPFFCRHKARR